MTIKHANSQEGMRNIYVHRNIIGIKTLLSKMNWATGTEKPIWRFLPPELSRHVLIYISVILPFRQALSGLS